MAVAAADWVDLLRREYLELFVPGGGSAIRFVVGDEALLDGLRGRVASLAEERRLHFVAIDGTSVKLHMIQDVFFAVAREIDWDVLAQRWVERVFYHHNYVWPRPGEAVSVQEIAEANGVAATLLSKTVQQWLTAHILNDGGMAQDFRSAMTHLCMRRMELADARAIAPVTEWLRGELRGIGPVRQVPIGAKISRHNGRVMLLSLCHWLKLVGGPGLCVTIDLRQLARSGPAARDGLGYSPAAVLDALEVLRQLIDDLESFESFVTIVMADPSFVDGDPKRSLNAYRALKERIWPDVHARGHENPLSPLLLIAGDVGDARPDHPERAAGVIPFAVERVAIEALRAGVPNRAAIRLLGSGEQAVCDRFVRRLRQARSRGAAGRIIEGELVSGDFGAGKSHLIGHLAEQALSEGFIVSTIAISKETPLFNLEQVFAAAIRNAITPGMNDDVMTAVISRLDPGSAAYGELEAWVSSPRSGLSPIFAALLFLIPKQVTTTAEDLAAIARFFGGAKLGLSKVRQWLRASGGAKLFDVRPVKAADLVAQRLLFAPRLFAAAGFGGWCILLDEVELIGRYSRLQRGKSYAELCRWLGLHERVGVPGVVGLGAITSDFKDALFTGRLDQEKVPRTLEAKGLNEQARLSEVAMRLIERQWPRLAAPDEAKLRLSLDRVRGLYERSYGWTAPLIGIGERRTGKTMRESIKSWVTEWDIQRLYGTGDEIVTEALPSDFTENPDLEQAPPLEAAEDELG